MHATVRKILVYKFKTQLIEGQIYIISYFGVGCNTGFFRTTKHEYRLSFQLRTIVRPYESEIIPLYGFKFVGFDEILQFDNQYPYLVGNVYIAYIVIIIIVS